MRSDGVAQPKGRLGRWWGLALPLLGLWVFPGCSDQPQWRGVQPPGWQLQSSFPCKPDRQTRGLALAGEPVQLTLLACSVQGHTFGLASAELSQPQRVPLALQALSEAPRAHLQGPAPVSAPAAVPGMTPGPQAQRWRMQGQRSDGQPMVLESAVFSHGMRVFQASVVGPVVGTEQATPFFSALRVVP